MTREEIIQGLQFTIDMFLFDPNTGETYTEPRNDMDKTTIDACKGAIELLEQTRWIPVSERLPEDFGLYLITLENGDVCQCEFNPDFIDEEHENGAFTYYHQYFDGATLGMIDEEEEAVDAIAWMPFEPYEPQESEGKE